MDIPLKKETGEITVDTADTKLDNASQLSFMSRSRIRKSFKKQTKKSIALFLGGTLILIAVILFFGIPLLVNFTVLLDNTEEVKSEHDTQLSYVPSPSLDSEFSATNSATVKITGNSDKTYTVTVFNNKKQVKQIDVGNNGKFTLDVELEEGENTVTARATSKEKVKSAESDGLTILYLPNPPKLEISSPSENQEFKGDQKFAELRGTTSEGSKVTINGFWAVMSGSGSFRYSLPLKDGDNPLTIVSIDQAGNKTEKSFTVKYSQ